VVLLNVALPFHPTHSYYFKFYVLVGNMFSGVLELNCIAKGNYMFLTCDGKCHDHNFYYSSSTWSCNGVCQNLSDPCKEKCPSNFFFKNCNHKCEKIGEQTVYQCGEDCLDINTPCNGICPKRTVNYLYGIRIFNITLFTSSEVLWIFLWKLENYLEKLHLSSIN